jgi:hypothetical protein
VTLWRKWSGYITNCRSRRRKRTTRRAAARSPCGASSIDTSGLPRRAMASLYFSPMPMDFRRRCARYLSLKWATVNTICWGIQIWEPSLNYLVSPTASPEAHRLVDEIWSWEAVQHGDSELLNGEQLGCFCECAFELFVVYILLIVKLTKADWSDNSRDMIQFLLYFLPSPSQSESYFSKPLPTHLPLQPSPTALARMARGFKEEGRELVAVGHSFGGCCL